MPIPAPPPWDQLQPGDLLLYRGTGVWSWLIRVKTFSDVSHCEAVTAADPQGMAVAARRHGVGCYPLKRDALFAIRRPVVPVDLDAAMTWFYQDAAGESYDWWGLLRFFNLGKPSLDKQFCSELLCRWYRHGGLHAFDPGQDADRTSPGMFLTSIAFTTLWSAR